MQLVFSNFTSLMERACEDFCRFWESHSRAFGWLVWEGASLVLSLTLVLVEGNLRQVMLAFTLRYGWSNVLGVWGGWYVRRLTIFDWLFLPSCWIQETKVSVSGYHPVDSFRWPTVASFRLKQFRLDDGLSLCHCCSTLNRIYLKRQMWNLEIRRYQECGTRSSS